MGSRRWIVVVAAVGTGVGNSDQDAMAQQSANVGGAGETSSETTASVDGSSHTMSPLMTAALEKACAAQPSGNEAACMAALDEARGVK